MLVFLIRRLIFGPSFGYSIKLWMFGQTSEFRSKLLVFGQMLDCWSQGLFVKKLAFGQLLDVFDKFWSFGRHSIVVEICLLLNLWKLGKKLE